MPAVKCSSCNTNITRSNSGVTCTECKKSLHWNCVKLNENVVRDITSGKNTQWICLDCDKRKSTQLNDSTATNANDSNNNILSIQRINSVVCDMQAYLNDKFGELQEITKVLNDYGSRISQIEDEGKTFRCNLNDLDVRVDNIEQTALLNSLEISGVPMDETDDPADIICRIGSFITFPTTSGDWSNIFRQYRKTNQDKPPSIIIYFIETSKRDGFLSAAKAHRGISTTKIGINGCDKLIYVNEHLTKARKKLFYSAKTFMCNNNFKYLWTNKGKIYLRKDDGLQAINVNFYTDFKKLSGSE